MTASTSSRILAEALRAGEERDYRRAVDLLTGLLAQGEAPREALLYLGRSHHALGEGEKAVSAFRAFLRSGGDQAAGFFFLGRAYLAAGRAAEASRSLKASLEADPDSSQAWALLGAAQLRLRRSKLALECLEKATTLAPEDARVFRGYLNALFVRACRLLDRGEADMARQMLSFAIENGLDGPGPRLWRAKAYRELGRANEALADCEAAIADSPQDGGLRWLRAGLLLSSGRQEEALAEFQELRESYPDLPGIPQDAASFGQLRCSVAFRDERWKDALSEALILLRQDPKNPSFRAIAAESLRALGQAEKAADHWRRAIEADPRSSVFHLGLALALFEATDYQGAADEAERARHLGADPLEVEYYSVLTASRLKADPAKLIPRLQSQIRARGAEPRLMFALGEALYASGRPDLASGWFAKVLHLVPDHELSLLYAISIAESLLVESGQEGEDSLIQAYEAYLDRYPDNQRLRREFSRFVMRTGHWDLAASVLEEGLAWEEEQDEKSRRFLALALRNAGRYREAAIAYRDLLREDPRNQELLIALAWCLEKDGKGEYALALIEKAPPEATAGAAPWMILGLLYEKKGRKEKAVDAFRTAIEREPDNARAWKDLGLLYSRMGLAEFSASCLEKAASLESAQAAQASKAGRPGRPVGAKAPSRDAMADIGREEDIPSPRKPPAALRKGSPAQGPKVRGRKD